MKIALLSMALLGGQLATPVSDRVPALNVEALCKATSQTIWQRGWQTLKLATIACVTKQPHESK